jgi:endogenous inhibitor of DNA gyrase (YacG/DUF329 family)
MAHQHLPTCSECGEYILTSEERHAQHCSARGTDFSEECPMCGDPITSSYLSHLHDECDAGQ